MCPHEHGSGGGFNPRRMRVEFGIDLCVCACHAGCPVSGMREPLPESTWHDRCSCPGASIERERRAAAGMQARDNGEALQERLRKTRARREAFLASRAARRGQSREPIRDTYVTELRSRGLAVPADEIVEATVDSILGSYIPTARVVVGRLGRIRSAIDELNRDQQGRHARERRGDQEARH